jgi:hypothetical protein
MTSAEGSIEERIRFAIIHRRLVEIGYSGAVRLIEPHDYGIQGGRERLLVYQRRGPSRPGQAASGWRLFEVSKIQSFTVLADSFEGSRGPLHERHLDWDTLHVRVK